MLELLASRVEMYRLLRDAFSYPLGEELLERLAALRPDPDTAPTLQAALRTLQAGIRGPLSGADLVELLNREHSRLMAGPGLPPAPPCGSYYRDQGHTLFGPETQAVAEMYRSVGLAPAHSGMPADHIALELEFMAVEASRACDALSRRQESEMEESLSIQRRFVRDHLLPLGRALSRSLLDAAPGEFFAGLAELLDEYLMLDAAFLEEVSASVTRY